MFILGVILPFFISIITGIFGRFLGFIGTRTVISVGMLITTLINFINIKTCFGYNTIFFKLSNAVSLNNFILTWSFQFDSLSCTMIMMVTIISFCVQIYSFIYMRYDPHIIRFLMYLQLFTFFMLLFVSAGNSIQLFLGWEGIGVCSYFLINFWFSRIQANKAALKAILMNKIGDSGLLICFSLIFLCIKTLDFSNIFSAELIFSLYNTIGWTLEYTKFVPLTSGLSWYVDLKLPLCEYDGFLYMSSTYIFSSNINNFIQYLLVDWSIEFIGILIFSFCFLGIMSKSAQLGLHMWLPDAMEGPTPVSALIHAATMVTAGIFIFIRMSSIFDQYDNILGITVIIGAMTAFYSAITAVLQHDAKKIIAFSTCSQLGYMIIAAGLSGYSVSFFHLVNHAVFKALLFMAAGSLIHIALDDQDIRNLGFMSIIAPLTKSTFIIATLAIIGVPFLTGFYSKDLIIESAYIARITTSFFGSYITSNFAYTVAIATAIFTTFYSLRLILISFFYQTRNSTVILANLFESSHVIISILCLLSLGSIFTGFLCKEYFIGLRAVNFPTSLPVVPIKDTLLNCEYLPVLIKVIPTIGLIIVIIMTVFLYSYFIHVLWSIKVLYLRWIELITTNINFNWIQYNIIKLNITAFYYKIFINLDKGIFEMLGPVKLTKIIKQGTTFIMSFQTKSIYDYSINTVLSGITFMSLFYVGYSFFLTKITEQIFQQSNFLSHADVLINCSITIAVISAIFCFWVEHNKPIISLGFFLLTIIPNIIILFILKVEYLALIMLIIYAGAIVILFLFILIMSNPSKVLIKSELVPQKDQPWIITISAVLFILLCLCFSLKFNIYLNWYEQWHQTELSYSYTNQFIFYTQIVYDITIFGEYLLNNAALIILFSGIILLIAMIGSIVITIM